MAGLIGIIKKNDHPSQDLRQLASKMEQAITYTGTEIFDRWQNEHYAVTRVHHGVINKAAQPIFNEDRSIYIVMEGEVFDYDLHKQRLIEQGHRFRFKNNDPEYCLHFYETAGQDAFVKLNGSFLIALYDANLKELLLVNDRFSSHPLFYYYDQKQLIFSTQIRSLLKFQKLPLNLNKQAVLEFFAFQRVLADRTFYEDINILPPASILRFRDGRIFQSKYWKMRYTNEYRSSPYYVEALADALRNAVNRRTCGNNQFGILLSGGLDSRAVLAADSGKISCAFTLNEYQNREVHIAKKIAQVKGCRHIFLQRDIDHYFRLVDEAVDMGDGMYRFDHAHFLGALSRLKEDCDIVLHGHGLDYTFQGLYLPNLTLRIAGKMIPFPFLDRISLTNLPESFKKKFCQHLPLNLKYNALFEENFSNSFNKNIIQSIKEILKEKDSYDLNAHNAWDYFILHSLFKHFTFLNFLCVRHYMDERTVLFDNDLFNLYLSMPPKLRLNGRIYKKALRLMSPELAAIPNANTGLKVDTPIFWEWIFSLTKKMRQRFHRLYDSKLLHLTEGSWPDMGELIRNNEKLKKLIEETLNDPRCVDPALFNSNTIDYIYEAHLNRKGNYADLLFLLLTFGRWYKKYGPEH